MTTEIAVINRLGVALATDSAVTVSGDHASKVFDTGDKLFELHETAPVGAMINGNMDILGVPWEIIVKDFRASRPAAEKKSMKDWLQCLLDFVGSHEVYDKAAEESYVENIAIIVFSHVKTAVSAFVFRRPDPQSPFDMMSIIEDETAKRRNYYAALGIAESLKKLSKATAAQKYSALINDVITEQFHPFDIPKGKRGALRALVIDALFADSPTQFSTGLIVAGYGDGEMFPSIAVAEIEGSVCGKIKYSHGEHVKINRDDNTGRVISFAQTDVVERLLSGADSRFINKSAEYIEGAIFNIQNALSDSLKAGGIPEDTISGAFENLAKSIADGYVDSFAVTAQAEFENDFNRMVALMPKQDIIELAEALVSITAIERKASTEQATVGGPVDVGFITRHEGFVWIKRKHYFDQALNPRYFWRKFNMLSTWEAQNDKVDG